MQICPHSRGSGPLGHLQSQIVVDAKASTPGGEPELYQPRAIVGLWLRSADGLVQAGLGYVDMKGLWEGF